MSEERPFDLENIETASFSERVRHYLRSHYGKTVTDRNLTADEFHNAHQMARDDMMSEIHQMLYHLLQSGSQKP